MCVTVTSARGLMALPSWHSKGPSLLFEAQDRPFSLSALAWVPFCRRGTAELDGWACRRHFAQLWFPGLAFQRDSRPTAPALLRGVVLKLLDDSSVSWHVTAAPECSYPREPLRDTSPCSELPEQENPLGILSALPASSSRKTPISPTVK